MCQQNPTHSASCTALEINPNSAKAYQGRDKLLKALRLNPHDPVSAVVLNVIALPYYCERDYIKALEARRVVVRFPSRPAAYRFLAASLGQLGRVDEAQDALRRAIEASPQAFDQHVLNPKLALAVTGMPSLLNPLGQRTLLESVHVALHRTAAL